MQRGTTAVVRKDQSGLRLRIRELAQARPRFGYEEGWPSHPGFRTTTLMQTSSLSRKVVYISGRAASARLGDHKGHRLHRRVRSSMQWDPPHGEHPAVAPLQNTMTIRTVGSRGKGAWAFALPTV